MAAPPARFVCPQCGARLKIQSATAVERQIDCPGCQAPLHVLYEPSAGQVTVTRRESMSRAKAPPAGSSGGTSHGTGPIPEIVTPATPTTGPIPKGPTQAGAPVSGGLATPATVQPASSGETESVFPTDELLPPPMSWDPDSASGGRRRWLITGILVALGLAGVAFLRQRNSRNHDSGTTQPLPPVAATASGESSATLPEAGSAVEESPSTTAEPGPERDPVAEVENRWDGVQKSLAEILDETGAYPPAVVGDVSRSVESRLSWMALVARRQEGNDAIAVDWNSDWNAPVNDRFVRRRLVGFQNPMIAQLTGEDGYPATHFVGLAGVGGEVLRPDPPRDQIGVFAPDQRITVEQIRDGLAQTAVVTGVQSQLGSWGAGGLPTIRSFQSEPVVEGPDGFGTGTNGSLLVLMADGRVQIVSGDVDPDVFRQMLTIDGENSTGSGEQESAPDPAGVGEDPGADESEMQAGEGLVIDEELDPPLSPGFAGDEEQPSRQVDPRVTLAQRLLVYEQAVRPRREVLRGVAELVGLPLRFEGEGLEGPLREGVGFILRDVSVQQVLERSLAGSGLSWKVEGRALVIFETPAKTGGQ
ncbi:MAG TPA: hypothetical protein DDY91_00220 [Planctomycetaceae bacterium]|nr:hypothetical protein [Planctomycetaceae bacterium]